jgi:hypothetical protein
VGVALALGVLAAAAPAFAATPLAPIRLTPTAAATQAVRTSVSPARLSLPVKAVLSASQLAEVPADAPKDCTIQGGLGQRCTLGNVNATRRFVVFGDSHAAALTPALSYFGKQHRWSITPVIHTGCTMGVATAGGKVCAPWWPLVVPRIRQLHPAFVIVAQYNDPRVPTQQMYDGLDTELTAFAKIAPKVIVMEDDPRHPAILPVPCLGAAGATLGSCAFPFGPDLQAEHAQIAQIVASHGDIYLPTLQWYCYSDLCPMVVGRTVVYRDTEHMTITYSNQLAPAVSAALAAIVD